jgi:hypothetical protein
MLCNLPEIKKIKICSFFFLVLMSLGVSAEDTDKLTKTTTINVEGGKLVREKQEVEVYDYHTGTFYSVHVYREIDKDKKSAAEPVDPNQPSTKNRP